MQKFGGPAALWLVYFAASALLASAPGFALRTLPPAGPQAILPVRARDKYLVPLWENAAKLVNSTFPADEGHVVGRAFLDAFYHQLFVWASAYTFPATRVQYVPIWKAANDAVRCNLRQAAEAVTCEPASDGPSVANDEGATFRFTLVREPLSRFVSGVSEINTRSENLSCPQETNMTYTSFDADSDMRAFAFVQDLASARMSQDCRRNWHVFSMLGPISEFQGTHGALDMIGKLENWHSVWQHLQEVAGCTFPSYDDKCGAHPESSDEDFGPRQAMVSSVTLLNKGAASLNMASSLNTNPLMKSALVCAVYLPDYVCLNYDLSAMANDCVQYGFASTHREWKGIVSGIREHLCPVVKEVG